MASSSRLKPGEKGKLITTIDTNGRIGLVVKSIHVTSNDAKRRIVNLYLRAFIEK